MSNQGWIKLHRELMDKAIWKESTPEQKVILITLLMMANHKEKEWEWRGQKYVASPGQFVTSLSSISKNCGAGISIQNIRTALKRFEKYEFLTNESTKQNRLITIVNWQTYQVEESETNKDINSRLTNDQQRPNKDLTTNKNDKNVRMKECKKRDMDPYEFISEFNDLTGQKELVNSSLIKQFNLVKSKNESEIFESVFNELKLSEWLRKRNAIWILNNVDKITTGNYRDFKQQSSNSKNSFHNFKRQNESDTEEELTKIALELTKKRKELKNEI